MKGRDHHLGGLTRRCENNIKIPDTEIGQEGMEWIQIAQSRVQWRVLRKR